MVPTRHLVQSSRLGKEDREDIAHREGVDILDMLGREMRARREGHIRIPFETEIGGEIEKTEMVWGFDDTWVNG